MQHQKVLLEDQVTASGDSPVTSTTLCPGGALEGPHSRSQNRLTRRSPSLLIGVTQEWTALGNPWEARSFPQLLLETWLRLWTTGEARCHVTSSK